MEEDIVVNESKRHFWPDFGHIPKFIKKGDLMQRQQVRFLKLWEKYRNKTYCFHMYIPHKGKCDIKFIRKNVKLAGKITVDPTTGDLEGDLTIEFRDGKKLAFSAKESKAELLHMTNRKRQCLFQDLCTLYYIEGVLKHDSDFTANTELCIDITIEKKKDKPQFAPEPPNQAFMVEYNTSNKLNVAVKIFTESTKMALKIAQFRYGERKGPAKVTPWDVNKDEKSGEPEIIE